MPNHKPKDHKKKLLKGKKIFSVQNYKSLLKQKTNAIQKYIDKYFEKNFIRPSLLAAAAPVLLIIKPGNRLEFCIDYRAFNKITIKNQSLILLINKMLKKLSSAIYFTNPI